MVPTRRGGWETICVGRRNVQFKGSGTLGRVTSFLSISLFFFIPLFFWKYISQKNNRLLLPGKYRAVEFEVLKTKSADIFWSVFSWFLLPGWVNSNSFSCENQPYLRNSQFAGANASGICEFRSYGLARAWIIRASFGRLLRNEG